uniref:U3 small nucleolar RNA-associated protein 25 n=1 Tax=Bursaphelenchus xylophilus TaxID=6326 RepID=A0A1I7SMJ5_BURXY
MNKKRKITQQVNKEEPVIKKLDTKYPDFFVNRFQHDVSDALISQLKDDTVSKKTISSKTAFPGSTLHISLNPSFHGILENIEDLPLVPSKEFVDKRLLNDNIITEIEQTKMLGIMGRYLDLCYASKTREYLEPCCYHILNHLLRSKNLIISNQKRLENAKNNLSDELIEDCRDQGLNRPKVLILAPFKKDAYEIVKTITKILLDGDRTQILNLAKFEEEYGPTNTGMHDKWRAPQEFKDLLSGNVDDSFRMGISLGKKAIKLFTSFENSDVILCSPLGLRMIIGDEEEEKRETDFLSSIELVVLERTNVMYMQNWEHLLTILAALNQIPQEVQTDISRVRHWVLKGHGPNYRQLIAFSEINFAELHSLFAEEKNITGQAKLTQNPSVMLENIEVPILQELHRFDCEDPSQQSDLRFAYFVRNVLPKLKQGTMVFIPSYFDYIRIRNYLKNDEESFSQIHEYASDGKIRKSRKAFASGEKKLLLITESFVTDVNSTDILL